MRHNSAVPFRVSDCAVMDSKHSIRTALAE
jgi:hypothetical protein